MFVKKPLLYPYQRKGSGLSLLKFKTRKYNSCNELYMSEVFDYILDCLQKLLPEFKIANAVIHFDEASPHMHVVGVPVWEGAKRGLSKKVSKRNVFTPQTLSVILQDKLRAEASYGFECYFKEQLAEKKKGRNHDLSVTEYKVAQESREENTTLKELLEKAYEFMKQFVIDGVNLLERFLESVGKVVGNVYKKTK